MSTSMKESLTKEPNEGITMHAYSISNAKQPLEKALRSKDKTKPKNFQIGATCKRKIIGLTRTTVAKNKLTGVAHVRAYSLPRSNCRKAEATNKSQSDSSQSECFCEPTLLHASVRSREQLQSLLKEIIVLNTEDDDLDEMALKQEIAKLRMKNNLPALNIENKDSTSCEAESTLTCEYYENSEDCSSVKSKNNESQGKDSGYDDETQSSGSTEDDAQSEEQKKCQKNDDESRCDTIIDAPEFVNLKNDKSSNKRDGKVQKGSLSDIKRTLHKFKQNSRNQPTTVRRKGRTFSKTYPPAQTTLRKCLYCDFICQSLTDYNLHISSHAQIGEERQNGADTDVVEIDD